ncbi:Cellulose synthase, partial [Cynara cardunculus var. scolymus]
MAAATVSLSTCSVQQPRAIAQRLHMLFHLTAVLAILYYRFTNLIYGDVPTLPWGFITLSELIFSFIWFLTQAFRWRPVVRTVSLHNLPDDDELPRVDVFICTADPSKEPTVEVMNTVLSAMGLDYPSDKVAVYLSDDGGAPSTLYAIEEACCFAKGWLPFCRKYGIKNRCPEMFFSTYGHDELLFRSQEFEVDEENMKGWPEFRILYVQLAYERFKENVEQRTNGASAVNDREPHIVIIHDNRKSGRNEENQVQMPLLVYVSREKRPSLPHRFKAGALNTLLRVSGVLSNAPYMLVLDCDMYCNEPTSVKQAMCFHLDPKLSSSLAFVQYPQIFYNVSQKDIYDGQARSAYKTKYQGMDGIGGTICSGTGYYLKKKALYTCPNQQDEHLLHPEERFGGSRKFIDSLKSRYLLHTRGWKSVYLYPNRPCFLGCTTIDMKDAMVQLMKWSSGLLQVGLSRFNPLVYGASRMSILQTMCYAYFMYTPLLAIAFLLYGTIPQFCLLKGVAFGDTIVTWWNEQRIFFIKCISALLFGCADVMMKSLGVAKANFRLTNKVVDKEKMEKYENGKFDFEGAKMFMIPMTFMVLFNVVCFLGGVKRVIHNGNLEEMFGQVFMSWITLIYSYPILKGLVPSGSKGFPSIQEFKVLLPYDCSILDSGDSYDCSTLDS